MGNETTRRRRFNFPYRSRKLNRRASERRFGKALDRALPSLLLLDLIGCVPSEGEIDACVYKLTSVEEGSEKEDGEVDDDGTELRIECTHSLSLA